MTSNTDVFVLHWLTKAHGCSSKITLGYTLKCVKPVLNLQLSEHCALSAPVQSMTSQNALRVIGPFQSSRAT